MAWRCAGRLSGAVALGALVTCLSAGCTPPSDPDLIVGVPANEGFAKGRIPSSRIKAISVYLLPRAVYTVGRYSELARLRAVVVEAEMAPRELVDALSAEESSPLSHIQARNRTAAGVIQCVLDSGETVYLSYDVAENYEVYVYPPPEGPAEEPRGHWQNALLPWLQKYACAQSVSRE